MNVEVFLTGHQVGEEDVEGRTVVVIDVLRASSTIITALANGARAVIPVADMDQAGKIAMNLDPSTYLLGGERDGDRIDGYHLGNSPLEYTPDVVQGKTIILNTTNGTRTIWNARSAQHLVIGSFLNADQVVQFIRKAKLDVTIICAGRNNRVALDDTLCAGLILYRLWEGQEPEHVSDAAHIALTQYLHDRDRLAHALRHSNHARWLSAKGYGADVEYCLQLDVCSVLPYYRENRLVVHKQQKPSESAS
ncbi:2-phosphosulfolactate phosphatase [Rhodothermus profundi]|uniref:Probable 2-phosphosulfolactate phosphatase n=1 Tax=Rhodothermus profundi TaxID=633813 RepID=A0A1M6WR72_9BACT|nr:2-phosphosulfolactate phosphatase [Rhodothermus profundi]SHK96144.1 2-phosphosulfolactate phosphatase [Rhodothermus profundi]